MKFWYRRGLLAWLLWPASLVFSVAVVIRKVLYKVRIFRSAHPGIPVIVVGNVTVGGTGKTPLVLWLAVLLAANGWRVGVVSRGHGGSYAARAGRARLVTAGDDPADAGDEALLLARESGCPVAIGVDRLEARIAAVGRSRGRA